MFCALHISNFKREESTRLVDDCLSLSIKLKDVETKIIRENDGTYAIACSALGVYTVGNTLEEAKKNFKQTLELHLSVLKEKAIEAVA